MKPMHRGDEKKPMRILSVTAQKPNATGSGVYLMELVREFAALGHAQAVVAGVYESDAAVFPDGVSFYPVCFDTAALPFPIAGMSDEMPYPSMPYREMTDEMTAAFLSAFTDALHRAVAAFAPDVILCHHLYLVAALTRRLFPHIQVWGVCHGSDLRQMYTNPLRRDYIKSALVGLDRVFCLHEVQRQAVLACYGMADERVRVVGSGYNAHIFFDRGERLSHEDTRLVYAGKISEKKGVYSLLAALGLLGWRREDFSLRLCGGWNSEKQRDEVEKLIDQSGYDVTMLGSLDQTRLAAEFNRGDVFILPSFYEGLPLVLAESMACGMKAVCTELPGIRPWMDANIPGHGIRFVSPPEMLDADTPAPESLSGFERALAAAIREAAAAPQHTPDLSALSWRAVCDRILE